MRVLFIAATSVMLSGCLGGLLIKPHENSQVEGYHRLCIEPVFVSAEDDKDNETLHSLAVFAATQTGTWLYDKAVEGVRVEQDRYTASVSGKTTSHLYADRVRATEDSAATPPAVALWVDELVVRHYVADTAIRATCASLIAKPTDVGATVQFMPTPTRDEDDFSGAGSARNVDTETKQSVRLISAAKFRFDYKVGKLPVEDGKLEKEKVLVRISANELDVASVKAKVPARSWSRPWSLLLYAKPEYKRIDLQYTIAIQAHTIYRGVQVKADVAQLELPIKGVELPDKDDVTRLEDGQLADAKSDWFELPYRNQLTRTKIDDLQNPLLAAERKKDHMAKSLVTYGVVSFKVSETVTNKLGDTIKAELDRAVTKRDERVKQVVDELLAPNNE